MTGRIDTAVDFVCGLAVVAAVLAVLAATIALVAAVGSAVELWLPVRPVAGVGHLLLGIIALVALGILLWAAYVAGIIVLEAGKWARGEFL